jgi:transposase InsO family protein
MTNPTNSPCLPRRNETSNNDEAILLNAESVLQSEIEPEINDVLVNRVVNALFEKLININSNGANSHNNENLNGIRHVETDMSKFLRNAIPLYSGKQSGTIISAFLSKARDYFNESPLPTQQKIASIGSKLTNAARTWFDVAREIKVGCDGEITTWASFKSELIARFLPKESEASNKVKLWNLKQGDRSVSDYSTEFQDLQDLLKDKLSENDAVIAFTNGLNLEIRSRVSQNPGNLQDLKTVINSANRIEELLPNHKRSIQANFSANSDKTDKNNEKSNKQNQSKKSKSKEKYAKLKCSLCTEMGHSARYCKLVDQFIKTREQNNSNVASTSTYFIIDSGCSLHMVNDLSLLHNTTQVHEEITIADGRKMLASVSGNLKCLINGKVSQKELVLKNVLFIENLHCNLLSVRALSDAGFSTKFSSDGNIEISSKDSTFIGNRSGTLYNVLLHIRRNNISNCCIKSSNNSLMSCLVSDNKNDLEYMKWHRRLGHPSDARFTATIKLMEIGDIKRPIGFICKDCIQGKSFRPTFYNSLNRAKESLQLVHLDVIGPIKYLGNNDERFILNIIDDFSKFMTTFSLSTKDSNTLKDLFIDWAIWSERQSQKTLKCIRLDNGTEFAGIRKWCVEMGVEVQLSASYSPEQNGRAERGNRTIIESLRTLLHGSGFSFEWWPELLKTSMFLYNHVSSRMNNFLTPHQVFLNRERPLNLSFTKRIGCSCFALTPTELRTKLDSKTTEGRLIGYADGCKA